MPRKHQQYSVSLSDYHLSLIEKVGLGDMAVAEAIRTLLEQGVEYRIEHGLAPEIILDGAPEEIQHGGRRPGAGRKK